MILIKRLETKRKNPKEKLIAFFDKAPGIDVETDTIIEHPLSLSRADWDENTTNAVKRLLGLPVKKPLVYFRRKNFVWKQYPVASWEIVEEYGEWCSLKIHVEELGDINIHHAYFSEMQSPSFVRDMEAQDRAIAEE